MFKKILLPLILMIMGLTGCKHEEPAVTQNARRTILVYIEGRNDLASAALADLKEMHNATIPSDCRLMVYRSIYGDDNPSLVEIYSGTDSVVIDYPTGTSAVDPDHMSQVLSDTRHIAPADEFGLILWSHSSGWRQKVSSMNRAYGLENSWNTMSITDLAAALQDHDLDFVFFDTCYMGSVEVAYELRNVAPRMVASVCEVPNNGMPYDRTLPHLFNLSIDSGLIAAIDETVNYYEDSISTACPSTLSLINLTQMQNLAEAMKLIINNPIDTNEPFQRFASPNVNLRHNIYWDLFFDLGQYIGRLGGDTSVLKDLILHERHTTYDIWGEVPLEVCSGLTVYIPIAENLDYQSYDYHTLSWAKYLNLQ